MITSLRHPPQIEPLQTHTPEEDLYELSCLEEDRETPLDEYKTPLDSHRRVNRLEGWYHQDQTANYRITERRPSASNQFRMTRRVEPDRQEIAMNRTGSRFGSSVDLSSKKSTSAEPKMKQTHSQQFSSGLKSIR